jgi:hypothetical protein
MSMAGAGLVIIVLGTPAAFAESRTLFSGGSLGTSIAPLYMFLGNVGLLLFLIGMIRSRMRFLPWPAIAAGALYTGSLYGVLDWWLENHGILGGLGWLLLLLAPGALPMLIGLGLWIRRGWKGGLSP